jgi:hypothetical protein
VGGTGLTNPDQAHRMAELLEVAHGACPLLDALEEEGAARLGPHRLPQRREAAVVPGRGY